MRLAALLLGAALLAWPAALNGYPLVFIDTVSYLAHTIEAALPWDKTPVYGPLLHLFHWRQSLWPPLAAQALLLSWMVWLTRRVARPARGGPGAEAALHLLVCAALAMATSLPWFAATLMPDVLAGVAALALYLLGWGGDRLRRGERVALVVVGVLAASAHLSHLVVALAVLALLALARPGLPALLRAGAVPGLAVAVLLGVNLLAIGRPALSPNGAIFLLARLQADGPAVATLHRHCPERGWYLCDFRDRLPMESDAFLWSPESPVSRDAAGRARFMGSVALVPEARAILGLTFAEQPLAVLQAMLGNGLGQLALVRVGDTLGNEHLALSARRMIAAGFPAEELARFDAARQMRGLLAPAAEPFRLPHLLALLLALPLALMGLLRGEAAQRWLVAAVLAALLANAGATGALSKPHHRYQARIVWLLPLAALLALPRRGGVRPGGCAPSSPQAAAGRAG